MNHILSPAPPSNVGMEQAVIGAILLEKRAYHDVKDKLTAEMFFATQHQRIWEAVSAMVEQNLPIDLLTVSNWLKSAGELENAGGTYYLAELTSRVASSANLEYHALAIMEVYVRRELMFLSMALTASASNDAVDIFELSGKIEQMQNLQRDVVTRATGNKSITLQSAYLDHIKHMNAQIAGRETLGILSGKRFLDDFLGAVEPGLHIIAGLTGMGKSTFAMWLAYTYALLDISGAYIGLELSLRATVRRFMAMASGVRMEKIKAPKLLASEDWNKITHANVPTNLSLPQISRPYIHLLEIEIEHLVRKGARYIFIDQLNWILPDPKKKFGTKNDATGDITRTLAQLSIRLNVPIFLLHQFNRKATEGEPKKEYLRDSGNIEQDARVIILLDVPFKRDIKQMADGSSSINKMVLHIAKNGEGEAPLASIAEYIPHLFTYNDLLSNPVAPNFKHSEKYSESLPF